MSVKIKYLEIDEDVNVFVVGDIHGSYTLLKEKLKEAGFNINTDLLIAVGDLVDRGEENVDMEKWVEDYHKREQRFEDYLKEREKKDKELLNEYFTLIYNFKKTLGLNFLSVTLKDLCLSDMPFSHPSNGEFIIKTKYLSVYGGGFEMVDIKRTSTNHRVYMSEMDLGVEYRLFLREMKKNSNVGRNNFDMVSVIVLCCICVLLLVVFLFLFWL